MSRMVSCVIWQISSKAEMGCLGSFMCASLFKRFGVNKNSHTSGGERVGLGEGLGGNQWGMEIPAIVSFRHKKALSRVLGEGWLGDKVGRGWG
jgi:hypothetical protein